MGRCYDRRVHSPPPRTPVERISIDTLLAWLDAATPMTLVDVREADEFAGGHLVGARNAPISLLPKGIDRTDVAPIVLYCARGPRAERAASLLIAEGCPRVVVVREGYEAWSARGLPVRADDGLADAQRARYARHLSLPELGVRGQRALASARVLVVGLGGLGSPIALYLAAAGVGTLGLADADRVELSNLQRQIIHGTERVGMRKVDSAAQALASLNPEVQLVTHAERVDSSRVDALIAEYDLVVDGTDNFATRYLLNDAAVRARKVVSHGSILRFEGQVSTFAPGEGPCYRCVYPSPPALGLVPSCGEAGVLGVLPGVIGAIQATEVIKRIVGVGASLVGRLLLYDALEMRFREMRARRDPHCRACGALT